MAFAQSVTQNIVQTAPRACAVPGNHY